MAARPDIYGGQDPREIPLYSVVEAARILKLPPSTLRSWVQGNRYETKARGTRTTPPLFRRPPRSALLSFSNLIEAHVLANIRREREISAQRVRAALGYVQKRLGVRRPLLSEHFKTDGKDLFVERYGKLIKANEEGQLVMAELLSAALERVERDAEGIPVALYPWRLLNEESADAPRPIVVDPRHRFGAPMLSASHVPVAAIVDRWQAGERLAEIAEDFRVGLDEVEDAVRWWSDVGPAASAQ